MPNSIDTECRNSFLQQKNEFRVLIGKIKDLMGKSYLSDEALIDLDSILITAEYLAEFTEYKYVDQVSYFMKLIEKIETN